MNILVLNHHHVGDVICTTSLVLGIRAKWPEARLAMFVRNRSICEIFPPDVIDQYYFYSKKKWHVAGLMREMSHPRPDLLVCTTELSRSWFVAALCAFSRAQHIVAEDTIRFAFQRCTRVPFQPSLNKFESNREIAKALEVTLPYDRPYVYVDPAVLKATESMLPPPGGEEWDQRRIAIAPGYHSMPAKAWPSDRFAALIDCILDAGWGRPVLMGSPQERPLGDSIQNRLKSPHRERCLSAVGVPLAECAAMVSRCDLLVSNDSGLAHMASALRVPVIGLFGPTAPERSGPYLADKVISMKLPCSPCYPRLLNGCGNPICMTEMPVAKVFAAVEELNATILSGRSTTEPTAHNS